MQKLKLEEILEKLEFTPEEVSFFSQGEMKKPLFYKGRNQLHFELFLEQALPFVSYCTFIGKFEEYLNIPVTLTIEAKECKLPSYDVQRYIHYFSNLKGNPGYSRDAMISVNQQEVICLFSSRDVYERAQEEKNDIEEFLRSCGISYYLKCVFKEAEFQIESKPLVEKVNNKTLMKTKKTMPIADIIDEQTNVKIKGRIFDVETRKLNKTNTLLVTLGVHDDSDAVFVKLFEGQIFNSKFISSLKKGQFIYVEGNAQHDRFSRELTISANKVVFIPDEFNREDQAEKKRIEFHAHSKYSEMDGVCEAEELVKQAYQWGHDAIAITDHMVIHAFPAVQRAVAEVNKKGTHQIKPIYGVEMNLVNDELKIVSNVSLEQEIPDTFVVFDIETTGLSNRYDHIVEFGAVLLQNGAILAKKQLFIQAPIPVPAHITDITGIGEKELRGAKPIEEVIDEILAFLSDYPLVAHNADFDVDFLNAILNRLGKPTLVNPVIDTLNLARVIQSDRRIFRLGNVARFYGIVYDEEVAHRADYDADILGQVFFRLLNDVLSMGCRNYGDIQALQKAEGYKKAMKRHVSVLAKNQSGLKELFQLVSLSHTEYLSVLSKSSKSEEEYASEPRIVRSVLNSKRENLLIGSSCYNSELFETAANKSQEQLEDVMQFYDYIEVQAPGNYAYLLMQKTVPGIERLHDILENIILTAQKLGKIVIASGDVHYLNPEDKIYRDIYISSQGIGGVRHPLYIYDNERRRQFIAPDQHFRTTDEMLEQFSFLNDELAYEIVVKNTHLLSSKIDMVYPVKDRLYTPRIDGADEKLRDICYDTAHEIYGEHLPKIVSDRLEKELKSIITHGFGVIYYISHLIVQKSLEHNYLVGSRGSVGSSFVATMAKITEVNPLPPHYICPSCKYNEFVESGICSSGYDLDDKACPVCGATMKGDGQDIPFETFLGFEGDKVPDIDLNFSGDFQETAHAYTKEIFGESFVYRAGTIGTVAERTAFGYVSGYCEEKNIDAMRQARRLQLARGCGGVKRTTGQHPGGIIVIPRDMDVHDFTPVQYPANNPTSEWKTTHFEFHDIHDNVLKLDLLGHVDPTAMKLLEESSGIDVRSIPMNDKKVMSLFSSTNELNIDNRYYSEKTAALGLPEFGTSFVRGILEATKPTTFSDLVRISGLSHGTDVWLNNARDLVSMGKTLADVIGCRDDIMVELIQKGLDPKTAFDIMESVRKGRGLDSNWISTMKMNNIQDWYIDSCQKIKYMFPKAHAVAYVTMAVRVAWFKVYYPQYYYQSFFTLRCDAYDIETMVKGKEAIENRLNDILNRLNDSDLEKRASSKEVNLIPTLEVAKEMYLRGYRFSNIRLHESDATTFLVDPNDEKILIPPFSCLDGLGANVARSIVEAREENIFISKEDLINRTQLSTTLVTKLDQMKVLEHLQEKNQMSLF